MSRGAVIALGGGRYDDGEVMPIFERIVSESGKEHPHVVFLPTAGHDDTQGDEPILESFEKLGCTVETLKLTDSSNSRKHIYDTLVNTDIVYAGGGNLEFMMNTFRATGADEALREAHRRGKVLSGLSSGAMCWFDMGYDDCGENGSFVFIDCIGLLPYCYCPHFISESWRSFETAVRGCRVSGIGVEDGAALIFKDGKYSTMHGNDGGSVFFFDKERDFAKSDITGNASELD